MTPLNRAALARVPLSKAEVESRYGCTTTKWLKELMESHERLRLDLAGAEILRAYMKLEIAAVLAVMNNNPTIAQVYECTDRLRKLLPNTEANDG